MLEKILRRMGLGLMTVFGALLLVTGIGDLLYPDTLSCYVWQEVDNIAVFTVETMARDHSSGLRVSAADGDVRFLGALSVKNIRIRYYDKDELIPGGMPFGVRLYTEGLLVTGTDSFLSEGREVDPADQAGLESGDLIVSIDGLQLKDTNQLIRMVEKCGGKELSFTVLRNGKQMEIKLNPRLSDDDKKYRAGLWVKNSTAGIGTVTYIDPADKSFAGLGHGITDSSSGDVIPMASGEIWSVTVDGIEKGKAGDPGEIKGSFTGRQIGILDANTPSGVYGTLLNLPEDALQPMPVGLKSQVTTGPATILSTVTGEGVKEYTIEIEKINSPDSETKNFLIKVTDPELLGITGGIVQGM